MIARTHLMEVPEQEVDHILDARERTHGDYKSVSRIAQHLRAFFRDQEGWDNLSYCQRESLDMISSKIARILSGDPNENDHWVDIAGYARLALRDDDV